MDIDIISVAVNNISALVDIVVIAIVINIEIYSIVAEWVLNIIRSISIKVYTIVDKIVCAIIIVCRR